MLYLNSSAEVAQRVGRKADKIDGQDIGRKGERCISLALLVHCDFSGFVLAEIWNSLNVFSSVVS